ncbi:Biotin carboxyl carrier protein of acetyl-CoA carboxylase [Streptomyces lydicus]|nr:Biotin carboxyl carrier protein of acetyl-CoA carboxylase [Streptomyces lydicus]
MTNSSAQVLTNEDGGYVDSLEREMAGLGTEAAMEFLGRGLALAVRAAPHVPSRARVRFGCASIEVEWPTAAGGTQGAPAAALPQEQVEPAEESVTVAAPVVGTFYRAPEPGARPFVEVGSEVEAGQQIGIVEAMKLMNPILAEAAGTVVQVVADDAEPVEYGQPLLLLRPRAEA